MQHHETDIGPSSLNWGEKEQTESTPVPLITGTALAQNLGTHASVAIPLHMSKLMAI